MCNVGRCLICTDYNVTNSGLSSSQSVDNVLRASVHYTRYFGTKYVQISASRWQSNLLNVSGPHIQYVIPPNHNIPR